MAERAVRASPPPAPSGTPLHSALALFVMTFLAGFLFVSILVA